MSKVIFFGAHSDDNILSAGQTISAVDEPILVTMFSGSPDILDGLLTAYDKLSGFANTKEAREARVNEDKEAAYVIGATKIIQFDHVDAQYGQKVDQGKMVQDIQQVVEQEKPDMIVSHLGVNHTDHVFVNESFMDVAKKFPDIPAYLYEDLPNRVLYPEIVQAALERVRAAGFNPRIDNLPTEHLAKKLEAMMCYKSQLLTLDVHLFTVPERLWRIN